MKARFIAFIFFTFLFSTAALAGGSISGKLLKSNGRPLPYTEIEIVPVSSAKQIVDYRFVATSNTAGSFSFKDVPNGEYTLSVNFDEKPTELSPHSTFFYPKTTTREQAQIFKVDEQTRLTNVVFQLLPQLTKRKITGKIVFADGAPAKNALLALRDVAADDYLNFYQVRTDADGNFSMFGFDTRKYQLFAIMLEHAGEGVFFDPSAKIVAAAETKIFILDAQNANLNLTLETVGKPDKKPLERNVGVLILKGI